MRIHYGTRLRITISNAFVSDRKGGKKQKDHYEKSPGTARVQLFRNRRPTCLYSAVTGPRRVKSIIYNRRLEFNTKASTKFHKYFRTNSLLAVKCSIKTWSISQRAQVKYLLFHKTKRKKTKIVIAGQNETLVTQTIALFITFNDTTLCRLFELL